MPWSTYAEWLAANEAPRIMLLELQLGELATGWTLTPAQTNTYQISWAQIVQPSVVPGGVYRRFDLVRQNDTDLTERTSIATVEANAGSFWLDTATETLYVHTTTGSDPDTFTAIMPFFSLFFATEAVDMPGEELWEPRLTGVLPTIEFRTEDPVSGVKRYPSGQVELSNADGFFDALSRLYLWKNKKATFWFGGGGEAISWYRAVAVMRIENAEASDTTLRLKLRQQSSVLDEILPVDTLQTSEFPNLGEGIRGSYKPLIWGRVDDIAPPLVDTTAGAEAYLVCDNVNQQIGEILAVRAVRKTDGTVVGLNASNHYSISLANRTITVSDPMYTHADYEIRIDACGANSSGAVVDTLGPMALELLKLLGVATSEINESQFTSEDDTLGLAVSLYMREPKPARVWFRRLEQSGLLTVFMRPDDGEWDIEPWDPTYDASSVPSLADEDFVTWKPDDRLQTVFKLVRVKYNHRPATGEWSARTASDSEAEYAQEAKATFTIDSVLRNASAASLIAQRYMLLGGGTSTEVVTTQRGLGLMEKRPLEKVQVSRQRAPSATGSYVDQPMEIVGIKKRFSPPSIELRLGENRGIGLDVGRWEDASAPSWSTATAAERATNGFWTNDDGEADPGNPDSMVSNWW